MSMLPLLLASLFSGSSAVTWGVYTSSSCPGTPGTSGTLSATLDSNGCSGGWARASGNKNSYAIINCSSNCVCVTQYAGTSTCDASQSLGSNVKESCLDRCMGDCNGINCQTSGTGAYGHTFLKLTDGPIACQNQVADDQYECHTTGMDPSYNSVSSSSSTSAAGATTSLAASSSISSSASTSAAGATTSLAASSSSATDGATSLAAVLNRVRLAILGSIFLGQTIC